MKKPDIGAIAKSAKTFMVKRSPEILTGIGIAGMITTTILAVRATPKALTIIDDAAYEKGEELTAGEKVKACWKCYVPAAATCATSTVCLICASSVSSRRTTALAAAYHISESALAEYRDKTLETVGEKKEKAIREKISEDRVAKQPVSKSEVFITEKGDTLFLEPLSKRWFKSDIELIRKAENKLNKEMLHGVSGYVSLNEFYDEIGLDRTDLGDDLGWNTENLIDLDFDPTITEDDKPALGIYYITSPRYKYDDLF